MSRRLPGGPEYGYRTTDHSEEVALLRRMVGEHDGTQLEILMAALAADLLESHDLTAISLDNWLAARLFVEALIQEPILENGV